MQNRSIARELALLILGQKADRTPSSCEQLLAQALTSLNSHLREGLRVLKGLNCLGTEVRKLTTKRVTKVDNQIVVARGITTSKPAIRSFLRSCCNRTFTGGSGLGRVCTKGVEQQVANAT